MKIKLENVLVVMAMVAIILAIILNFDIKSTISLSENRALATFPDVSLFHEKFPSKMDKYINDRIGFKLNAFSVISQVLPANSRQRIENKALIGKNNWLFFNSEDETLEDFQRTDHLLEDDLKRIKTLFIEVNEFAKQNGILLYIVIPPMKHNVYPEFYLDGIKQLPILSKYEMLKDYIKDTDIPIVDLSKPLEQNKGEQELYYLSDTHWNYLGAFIGYKTLMNEIKKSFPHLYVYNLDDFNYEQNDNHSANLNSDLIKIIGTIEYQYNEYGTLTPKNDFGIRYIKEVKVGNNIDRITETNNIDAPKAYIVHDSFLDLHSYIRNSFSRTISKLVYFASPLNFKDDILKEKPDILIWELQERYLKKLGK